MEPTVSICLPVFNGEEYLSMAIESVLNQTYKNFELLISDDGSTDSSLEIIESYAKLDARIKFWLNDRQLGLFGNYNAAMGPSRGAFIKPHAQDDVWAPTLLERTLDVLFRHPEVALVSTGRRLISADSKEISQPFGSNTPVDLFGAHAVYPAGLVISRSLDPLENFIGEPCTVMFRREWLGEGFSTKFRHLGDLEYWLRILQNGDYAYIPDDLAFFRQHKSSTSEANKAQIWHATDVIHMSYACREALLKDRRSRTEFIRESLQAYSFDLYTHVHRGEVQEKDIHPEGPLTDADQLALKEALFHALLVYPSPAKGSLNVLEYIESLERALTVKRLENSVQTLLRSVSWTSTRVFRELRRLFSGTPVDEPSLSLAGDTSQRDYIRYLRKVRRDVLNSRSWRITRPFRAKFRGAARNRSKVAFQANMKANTVNGMSCDLYRRFDIRNAAPGAETPCESSS